MIGTFSNGILKHRLLPAALGDELVRCGPRSPAERLSGVIGWGLKDNTKTARAFAERHDLPYFSLEDGFIRSVGLGVDGAEPFGFILDRQGIYYDARQPSDLEDLIKAENDDDVRRARGLIDRLVRIRATKYNHVWQAPNLTTDNRPAILLIDQTYGDLSVKHGLADEESFRWMVEAAMRRYPGGRFFVKTHPDVIAGRKKGYLTDRLPSGVTVVDENCNPIALLQKMDHVLTVTSQMGFEALLVGKPVTCFGMPFYAGWGLTEDFAACPRRSIDRSLEQVFAAAYLRYVRYVDPITRQRCKLERILDLIEHHQRTAVLNKGEVHCFGFQWWKSGVIKRFIGASDAKCVFTGKRFTERIAATPLPARVAVWGMSDDGRISRLAHRQGIAVERVEDGFVRSVGLGSNFAKPTSLIVDRRGIYFDPRQPSDLEHLLNTVTVDEDAMARASRIRELIVKRGISKYNTGCCRIDVNRGTGRTVILVPGQVEDDASIRTGCIDVRSNVALLEAVRQSNPEALILYKPHPDVVAGNRIGAVDDDVAGRLCDQVIVDCDIAACIDRADEIHTMTSLTGFEALLRGKSVHTYGLPFYAGWGLTTDRHAIDRRRRKRTIEELVHCALVLYPRYYNWEAGLFVSVEDAIESLLREKNDGRERSEFSWWRQLDCKMRNLVENIGLMVGR